MTGSEDKTVRVWSLAEGELLQTIRLPSGPGYVGRVFAVALSSDGNLIAAGGWLSGVAGEESIYLFDRSGKIVKRINGLADVTLKLVFSTNDRFLAAALGDYSLHIYDKEREWAEVFCSTDYGEEIYGITFSRDGRLATTCYDAKIRLYTSDFNLAIPPKPVILGKVPRQIEFNPVRNVLAVGYADAAVVEYFDGDTLESMGTPNVKGITTSLPLLAWSKDGQTLFAGGEDEAVFTWAGSGQDMPHKLLGGGGTITSLQSLLDGGLVVTDGQLIKRIERNGRKVWTKGYRPKDFGIGNLAVSYDGVVIDFKFEGAQARRRFDLSGAKPKLIVDPREDRLTAPPKHDGRQVERQRGRFILGGNVILLDRTEWPRAWAISYDSRRFVFSGKWTLRSSDANLQPLWRRDGPGSVWAVNITGNGQLVVASYDDGTIRWHHMGDGRELLALMLLPDSDKANWVAWTPEGFYAATVEAFGVLQWHINHGADVMGTAVRVSDVPMLNRPDVLVLTLQEGGVGAMGIATANAARKEVQRITGSAKPPGARLHVLAIGVSQYGETAKNLSLKFAAKDAMDLTAVLLETQDINGPYRGVGGLYAEVKPHLLPDSDASKRLIFRELAAIQRMIASDDTAVIMFAGHGMMIDGEFYLLPYGVDATEAPASIKATAIPAIEFQKEVERVARRGRVLILLDACHSGAFTFDNFVLRGIIALGNATVLTSSHGAEPSREAEAWQNGAFTKVFLDALSDSGADANHDGIISMSELTDYLSKKLPELTNGVQQLGVVSSFQGNMFVTGLRAEQAKQTSLINNHEDHG